MRGDPQCPAGPNAIWEGAPAVWKERIRDRQRKGGNAKKGKGKGKGKTTQRTLCKRNMREDAPKEPCPNWSRGNGFCKYGPNCRLSHDGPKGGVKKRKPETVFLTTKKGKKARKKLASLVMKDVKETMSVKSNKEVSFDDEEDDSHLYQLIRGAPTVMILKGEDGDFAPVRKRIAKTDTLDEALKIAGPDEIMRWSQPQDSRLPYNKIDDADKIICIPGEHPFIPWNEYTGCCKPGEYDCEYDAFIEHHFRDERIHPLPDTKPDTKFIVTLMMS